VRAARATVVALVVWGIVGLCIVGILRGVTEPSGHAMVMTNGSAKSLAWLVLFMILPLAGMGEAASINGSDWWAAGRSKVAWVGIIAFVPFLGFLTYFSVVRWHVVGAYDRRVAVPPGRRRVTQRAAS
jgi:Phospholipase_D-nuclease N-terminal